SNGVSSAFLWLVAELYKKHTFTGAKTLESSLKGEPDAAKVLSTFSPRLLLLFGGILTALVAIATASVFLFNRPSQDTAVIPPRKGSSTSDIQRYQELIQKNPEDVDALVALANIYLEKGQLEQSIPLLEKIIQLQPDNVEWQFNLAKLYELADQTDKAETIYDQMLKKDPKQFKALVGKAMLRQAKGDTQTANSLFKLAEEVAPSPEVKKKIQELSQKSRPVGQ
ncbi:MAG: tetratricopeptide repeat protein, partial [Microcystaceae cyanobacterium]